jgi:hypothetical protein
MEQQLKVKRLSDKAKMPMRGSELAAGLDLYAAEEVLIPKRSMAPISLDVAIQVPRGTYGRVALRSGLAFKKSVVVEAGVIDEVSLPQSSDIFEALQYSSARLSRMSLWRDDMLKIQTRKCVCFLFHRTTEEM